MVQPASSALEPWTSFPDMPYDFIDSDFVHDARFNFKTLIAHCRGGLQVEQKLQHTRNGYKIEDVTKFWISLPQNRSFYARLRAT